MIRVELVDYSAIGRSMLMVRGRRSFDVHEGCTVITEMTK